MSHVIRISDEVFKRLQDEAEAAGLVFVSPDNVLRHILKMPQAGRKRKEVTLKITRRFKETVCFNCAHCNRLLLLVDGKYCRSGFEGRNGGCKNYGKRRPVKPAKGG